MIVVSDTSPLNYLILLGAQEVLPSLFGSVVTPTAVLDELRHSSAAAVVRAWAAAAPLWLRVQDPRALHPSLHLGPGETAALSLAVELGRTGEEVRVLIDEQAGRAAARRLGLSPAGTLAVLLDAASAGLIDLPTAIDRLRQTNFYASPALLDDVLRVDRLRREKQ